MVKIQRVWGKGGREGKLQAVKMAKEVSGNHGINFNPGGTAVQTITV